MRKYERRTDPIMPRARFLLRLVRSGAMAASIVGGALLAGVLGYHILEGFSWTDSLLNACMILGGMGPVDPLKTEAGKLFASAYALFSGVVFLTVAAVLFAPVVHRMLHRFHVTDAFEELDGKDS